MEKTAISESIGQKCLKPAPLPLLIVILLGSCFALGQEQGSSVILPSEAPKQSLQRSSNAAESLSSLTLRVATRMVLVDAVVTDGSGKPVTGLTADDFEIREDGKPQSIKSFASRTPSPQPTAPPVRDVRPAGFFSNIPNLHPEEGPPIIVLLDGLNTQFQDQVYMRGQLISFLKELGSRHNLAIYTLGSSLRLLQNFSADPEILQQALVKSHGISHPTNPAPNDDPLQLSADLLASAGLSNQLADFKTQIAQFDPIFRIRTTMQALRQIARNCAGYPGRKNLIWLSGGFPLSIDVVQGGPYFEDFRKTSNLLTDAQVAVYPVDARGLVAFFPLETEAGMAELIALHLSMNYVADWTGGRASYGRNDVDTAIAQAVNEGSTYYLLGYYPTNKDWNGQFRKIQVKLKGSGLQVRHRKGYFATDPTKNTPSRVRAMLKEFVDDLDLTVPDATMLALTAHVTSPASGHSQVFVDIGVDPHTVLFESQSDNRQQAHLEFVTVVHDTRGKTVTKKSDVLTTSLTSQTFAQVMASSLAVRQKFDLPAGKYLLRVAVRDAKTNLIGTLIASVEVVPPQ